MATVALPSAGGTPLVKPSLVDTPVPPMYSAPRDETVPLDRLSTPRLLLPTPKAMNEPLVTEPPATLSVPVPLAPTWKVPRPAAKSPITSDPALALVVVLSDRTPLEFVPVSLSMPVPRTDSVPVPLTVLLIVSVPVVWLYWNVPLATIALAPLMVAPSSSRTAVPLPIVPAV